MEWDRDNTLLLVRANLQEYNVNLSPQIVKVLESFKLDFHDENGFVSSEDSLVIQEYPPCITLTQMFLMAGCQR